MLCRIWLGIRNVWLMADWIMLPCLCSCRVWYSECVRRGIFHRLQSVFSRRWGKQCRSSICSFSCFISFLFSFCSICVLSTRTGRENTPLSETNCTYMCQFPWELVPIILLVAWNISLHPATVSTGKAMWHARMEEKTNANKIRKHKWKKIEEAPAHKEKENRANKQKTHPYFRWYFWNHCTMCTKLSLSASISAMGWSQSGYRMTLVGIPNNFSALKKNTQKCIQSYSSITSRIRKKNVR